MWKAIYIAADQAQAKKLCAALTEEGFLARVKPVSCGEDTVLEIQVPEAESEDAQTVICDMGVGL
ncbi:MAG: hypothetical protein IJ812_03780 [Schwartzia sp.]|nr:hypothetical protein [Schwartzia sp. (in: firmicutes)]MBR1885508.1 hypothetical protein [Schwartzia sp. (in: firmicutes)]